MTEDIRWQQRFANYQNALGQLNAAVELTKQRELSDLEKQGLIQAFEYTHELAWNCLKDFLQYQGTQDIYGSRDATRKAFEVGLVTDGSQWMNMIASRNRTSHTYNKETAEQILEAVINHYQPLFVELNNKLASLKEET